MHNKKKNKFIIFLVLGLLGLFSFLVDDYLVLLIAGTRNILFDYFLFALSFMSNIFIVMFVLTTLFLYKEHKIRWILVLWLSFLLSFLVCLSLKFIVQRPRPYEDGLVTVFSPLFYFISSPSYLWDFSFPSFHATLVFSSLMIILLEFRKFGLFFAFFSVLVAYSRVYFGLHYLSDVLFGALIGMVIGSVLINIEQKYRPGQRLVGYLKRT